MRKTAIVVSGDDPPKDVPGAIDALREQAKVIVIQVANQIAKIPGTVRVEWHQGFPIYADGEPVEPEIRDFDVVAKRGRRKVHIQTWDLSDPTYGEALAAFGDLPIELVIFAFKQAKITIEKGRVKIGRTTRFQEE